MVLIGALLLIVAAFALWDRSSPVSASPDRRMIGVGAALVVIGVASSALFWWLIVPVLVLLAGGALVVLGRHRVAPRT